MISHAMLFARRLNNWSQRRVVNMCNLGEQVMLPLKVQSTQEEGPEPICGCKIGGRGNLVDRPLRVHLTRACSWMGRRLDDVSRLGNELVPQPDANRNGEVYPKDYCDVTPQRKRRAAEINARVDRYPECQGVKTHLTYHQQHQFPTPGQPKFFVADSTPEKPNVVNEQKTDMRKGIEPPDIDVLPTVTAQPLRPRTQTDEPRELHVTVVLWHVRIGMVHDVMSRVPTNRTCAQNIEEHAIQAIEPPVLREGTVICIVLDIESNTQERERQRRSGYRYAQPRANHKHQKIIRSARGYDEEDSFGMQCQIIILTQAPLVEISVYAFSENASKACVSLPRCPYHDFYPPFAALV